MRNLAAVVGMSLCLIACGRAREPDLEAESAKAWETAGAIHQDMKAHFDAIVTIRDALIAGDLPAAQAKARWIVEDETVPGIATWQELAMEIRSQAAGVVDATSVEAATGPAAELARTCGRCHSVHSVRPPSLSAREPPPIGSARVPHMLRHQWAAERMWEGLVGPSEERWNAGIAELAETPLHREELELGPTAASHITDLATRVHQLGAEASGIPATAWDTRSALYARFLATCADCHRTMRPAVR
jgi:hypothetical protein